MKTRIVTLVPTEDKKFVFGFGAKTETITDVPKAIERLEGMPPSTILALMGGPGQNLLIRAFQLGHSVCRVPMHRLQSRGLNRGDTAHVRGVALMDCWSNNPGAFYVLDEIDSRTQQLRELTRVRINIQRVYRIPAQLQYQAVLREMEYLLPEEGKLAQAIRMTLGQPRLIAGAMEDEKELERQIKVLTKNLPIWELLHPGQGSVLPAVKGMGPAIGGGVIGEIYNIRRFDGAANLRAYARFHVAADGGFPRRKRGQVANWQNYLHRVMWLWSDGQVARYDHVWRTLYLWHKARECQRHPESSLVPFERLDGETVMLGKYSLGHLDKRAKRLVGSDFLDYLWGLWGSSQREGDPWVNAEGWYVRSKWPDYFGRAERELDGGLLKFLESEKNRRRKELAGVSE